MSEIQFERGKKKYERGNREKNLHTTINNKISDAASKRMKSKVVIKHNDSKEKTRKVAVASMLSGHTERARS